MLIWPKAYKSNAMLTLAGLGSTCYDILVVCRVEMPTK